jgi:hypothetical protein
MMLIDDRDEVCACGCFQSDHASQVVEVGGTTFKVKGHGQCLRCGECSQYTFERFAGPVRIGAA